MALNFVETVLHNRQMCFVPDPSVPSVFAEI